MHITPRSFAEADREGVKTLYKNLIRKCELLPKPEIKAYYKNFVRQGFRQHSDEIDKERIRQIIAQAKKDSDWILKKSSKMNDNLPQGVYNFLENKKPINPKAARQDTQLHLIRLPPIDIPSVEKFYSLASSIILRPSLADSSIYDVRAFAAQATYLQKPYITQAIERRLDILLDKILTLDDLEFIRNITLHRVSLIRQIFRKDRTFYYMLECWDFIRHTIRVFPMDRVLGIAPFRKELLYTMAYRNSQFFIHCGLFENTKEYEEMAYKYLTTFGEKLLRWAKEPVTNGVTFQVFSRSNGMAEPVAYMETYDSLKKKHYTKLCQFFDQFGNKTRTEREKDIHEDLAIASYLHVALRDLVKDYYSGLRFLTFVDLGCGNGLLTYLLTNLGWAGYGIDCRRRKLWAALGRTENQEGGKKQKKRKSRKQNKEDDLEEQVEKKADLREMIINPNVEQFPRDTTRIFIGNHPDELTPWIPIIAKKTMSHFIIIPCCPFKFDGSKFQNKTNPKKGKVQQGIKKKEMKHWKRDRQSPCEAYDEMADELEYMQYENETNKETDEEIYDELSTGSTYQNYLRFIHRIATECGYATYIDRLRIPSTKRVAIFGILESKPTVPRKRLEETEFWEDIQFGMNWFKAPKTPEVVNCTSLCRADIERVVSLVFKYLIGEATIEDNYFIDEGYLRMWNRGCQNTGMKTIIHCVLDAKDRKIFKDQAKGLQTLIKNHSHIFRFNKGCVVLRIPNCKDAANVKNKSLLHTKTCYFYVNHPRGCPLPDELCAFSHEGVSVVDKDKNEGEHQENESTNAQFDENMNKSGYQEDYEHDLQNGGECEYQDEESLEVSNEYESHWDYQKTNLEVIWEEDEHEVDDTANDLNEWEDDEDDRKLEVVVDLNESFRSSNTNYGAINEDDVIDLSEVGLFDEPRIR